MEQPGASFLKFIEIPGKIVGFTASMVALCAFVLPRSIWAPVEAYIAQIYGVSGHVYYEIAENRALTEHGQLYLLKKSIGAKYDQIDRGDRLRAASAVNFRVDRNKDAEVLFTVQTGECVIVTAPPTHPLTQFKNTGVISGGWLDVATSPCGLYQ